jgi:hypothetical protein
MWRAHELWKKDVEYEFRRVKGGEGDKAGKEGGITA